MKFTTAGVGGARATERPASLFAGVEPLEVFAELLADIDTDNASTEFYDRICEVICRLTPVLLHHARRDQIVSFTQSVKLREEWEQLGADVRL